MILGVPSKQGHLGQSVLLCPRTECVLGQIVPLCPRTECAAVS